MLKFQRKALFVVFGVVILYVLILDYYMDISFYHSGNFILHADEGKGQRENDSESLVYDHVLSQENIIVLRKKTISEQCVNLSKSQYWSLKSKGRLYSYGGLTYCRTFKVGSTFWLSILRFLAKDYVDEDGTVQKPYDIGRTQVQASPLYRVKKANANSPSGNKLVASTTSFMFARNPYTRLWSAYVDKFVLPNFWDNIALDVAKSVRPVTHITCVNDITFEEFVLAITRIPADKLNRHWMPIHMICNPCHVEFDVIGKMETFAKDYAYIIESNKVELVIDNMTKEARRKDEIDMLVKENFLFIETDKSHDKKCLETVIIAKRLWLAFQLNGYIHRNKTFPLTEFISSDKTTNAFLNIVFRAINSHTTDMKRDLKDQKTVMMAEVYKRVPKKIMETLKEIYKYDFQLFGYDPRPTFLYTRNAE